MYTQCPYCQTIYRVSDEQLQVAAGQVRCSRCNSLFNGLEQLHEEVSSNQAPVASEPARVARATAEEEISLAGLLDDLDALIEPVSTAEETTPTAASAEIEVDPAELSRIDHFLDELTAETAEERRRPAGEASSEKSGDQL